jgi:hypothetical protein
MLRTQKITDNFFLNKKRITEIGKNDTDTVLKPVPINFIVNIDVSGSMSYDLSLIRKQLKNKLPSLIKEGDTITIIWFSGNNQAGILKEEVEIKSLTNLQDLNDAIDKFLKPVGLTAFAKPLELTKEVISRIKVNRPNSIFSLLFLTDGGNNDVPFPTVLKALKELDTDLSASTFIEYGLYADSKRLTEMAELIGGEKILANGFDEYEPIFENKITKPLGFSKKILVDINDSKYKFCFTVSEDNEILVFSISDDNKILINDNIDNIYFFSENSLSDYQMISPVTINGETNVKSVDKILYSAIYVLSDRTLNSDAELVFKVLGDIYTYDLFNNSFGKQKLNEFKTYIKECVEDESKRFIKGYDENLVPDENAYCFMDLINDLTSSDDNYFLPMHEEFKYKRIGRKTKQKGLELSDELKDKISNASTIEELNTIVAEANETHVGELTFINLDNEKAFKLNDLVWNESRANLSVRVKYNGYVELPKNNKFGLDKIDTFIYRTYTIVKDGILNLTQLPVILSEETLTNLKLVDNITIIDLETSLIPNTKLIVFDKLPIINRTMVKNVSAVELAKLEWELLKLQGNEKSYKHYENLLFPKVSQEFVAKFSPEAEEYLKEIGITSFNGFNPKSTAVESSDFYMSVKLDVKVAGFSTIPKVVDVETKICNTAKKVELKPNETLLEPGINDYYNQITSELYTSQDIEVQKTILQKWLNKSKTTFINRKRELMVEIAKIKFALILSKGWFIEFSSFDENTLELELDDKKLKFTFDLKDEEIKI